MKKLNFKTLLLSMVLLLGISPNAWAIGFKQGNIFFDATGITMSNYTYFVVGKSDYSSLYGLSKVDHTNYYKGWCSNGDWWNGCTYFSVISTSSSWSGDKWGYDNCKNATYYAGEYTSSYDIDNTNIYELTPSGTSKGASFTINYRDGISALNTTQTLTVQLSTNGGNSYSTASKGLASVSATTYYFGDNWSADETGSISLTSGISTVSGSATAAKTSTVSLSVSNIATGYTFVGWYYSDGTLISTSTSASYVPKENKTVYARFKANSYTINYNANGGTGTTNSSTHYYGVSKALTANGFSRTGYSFNGWNTKEDGTGTSYTNGQSVSNLSSTQGATITLYAQWTEELTAVTISSNGNGTVSPANASVGVATTQSVTATPADGYHFVSWAVTGNAVINGNILSGNGNGGTGTLKATFAETTYPITVAAGANGSVASNSVSAGQITPVALPTATPANGYNFKNWTATEGITITNANSADGATIIATKAGTVTANFENAATYSLTVAAGTGIASVTGSQDDITLGQSYPITATVKAGYTWSGWAQTSGAGTAAFVDASSQNTNVTVTVGSVEVTASATPNNNTPYTVKHYKQNLENDDYTLVDTDNLTGTTDAQVTPAVKNYEGFTAPSTTTVTIAGDGSTTVTYNYARKSYTLTWAGLEGAATTSAGTADGSVKFGAALAAPTVEKDGYNFTGWTPEVPATMPAANSTYTAQWEEILYTITLTNATATSVQAGIATHPSITANAAPVGQKFKQWNTTGGASVASATSATTTVNATAEGTVTAVYEDVPTVFFDNTNTNWSNVFVYLMKEDVWEKTGSGKGAAISGEYYEYSQMTQIGTSKIYYYSYTTASPTQYIAFSSTDMHEYGEFHGNNGAYRGDFNECQPMFIPDGTHSQTNTTEYYSSGNWDTYSTTSKYYIVGNDAVFGNWSKSSAPRFTKESTTSNIQTVAVTLVANHTYQIKLETCADSWYGVDANTTITSTNYSNIQFDSDKTENCSITTTEAGTYTFTFDNSTKKLSVDYPEEQSYKVTISADANTKGSVSHSGEQDVLQYTGLEVTATPNPGYYFVNWTTTGGAAVADEHAATTKVTASAAGTVTANFAEKWIFCGSLNQEGDAKGGMPGWHETENANAVYNGNTYTITMNLTEANTDYKFQIREQPAGTLNGFQSTGAYIAEDTESALNGDKDVLLKTTVAGDYTFVVDFSGSDPKVTVSFPAIPVPAVCSVSATRKYNETPLTFIESGTGAEDAPYKYYTDEKMTLTVTAIPEIAGVTAYYKFGEAAEQTSNTFDIVNPSLEKTAMVVKAYYKKANGDNGEAATTTIYYQGIPTPQLHLTASWYEKEENAVADNEQVIVYYGTTDYAGAATVTSQVDNAEAQSFMPITNETTKSANYQLPDKGLHRYTFTATATVNSRTFTATTSVSVYRLVKITVTDTDNLMNHYYMWIQDSNPIQQEQAWPGSTFYSKLGNAHIFYVKYPSYTHFVLNNGMNANEEGATQTVDIEVPNQSTCYTIGTQVTGEENPDKGKYQVEIAECPNKLYVGDIANVEMYNGEGKLVQPQVDTDPELDVANLNISVTFGTPNIVTYDQRGTGFMLTALSRGTTTATVTYSIAGATDVVKNFNVTVGQAITIQAKIATNLGWDSHENIWIKYWGTDGDHYVQMKYVKYVEVASTEAKAGEAGYDLYTGRLPMPDGDSEIRFQIGYPEKESWYEAWRKTADAGEEASQSGCYTVYYVAGENANRGISRDGDNCFVDYQVEIDMNSGISYFSNKVDNNDDIVSFFAPGSDKKGYEAGSVRIMKNGEQSASISTEMFETSGVYTAKISGNGIGLTEVALYKGDYYIRTDAAADNEEVLSTGWDDYKKASHKFTQFSLYPGAKYNYYWVRNNKRTSDGTHFNVKGCVGNDYNPDLANMISVNDYTDSNGDIVQNTSTGVNLRFGYNPQTNYFERAILKGAGDNYFLNIQGDNIYNDEACTNQVLNEANYNAHPEYSKFNDVSDWVYEKLIFAKIDGTYPLAQVVLKSKSFNDKIMYQLGYEVDDHGRATKTPTQKVVMGNGTEQEIYTLRVIYDYKTNRLSATWEPSGEIDKVMQVNADILFVSNEGNEVKEITFKRDSMDARLTSLQSVMYVLEIENNDLDKTETPDAQYWIALPFECKISDIFGIENYITLNENRIALQGYWGIMRYRGDLRAQKGWFIEDTPDGFWEWMYPTETLVPGEGYVLYVEKKSLSWNSITIEEPCEEGDEGCEDGKRSVNKYVKRFYFPSLVEGFTMSKSSDATSKITYPNQPCNITSPADRRAEDSNWKVIAPKSYNNVTISSANPQSSEYVLEGPGFIYKYDATKAKGSRYTATASEDFPFQAFHGYMAQYGGTITWNPYSKTEHPTSAPRFGAAAESEFKGGMLTIELVQNNEQLDRTFISLSKNGTEGFDQNLDLTKITENCAQIASISENVLYAGNTLPLDIELVPLNVKVTANGTYDIALEKSLEGLEVKLFDAFEQTTTLLDLMPATVTLEKGEYKDRFFLQFTQKAPQTPTNLDGSLEQYNLPMDKTQKLLINGNIYLINAGRVYNATGAELR